MAFPSFGTGEFWIGLTTVLFWIDSEIWLQAERKRERERGRAPVWLIRVDDEESRIYLLRLRSQLNRNALVEIGWL